MDISKTVAYFTRLYFRRLSDTEFNRTFNHEKQLKNIPSFRLEKIQKYINPEDKFRCLYSWKLLEKVMQDVFSLDLKKELIDINAYGKPFITNRNDIHFNISHSGEIVTCIVDKYSVGVDIENITPIDMTIASNFFQRGNVQIYSNCHRMNRLIIFINCGH